MSKGYDMKKIAKKFLAKHDIKIVNESSLTDAITAEGYSVIKFGSEQTMRTVKALGLSDRAELLDSFTYKLEKQRIVFIRENVSSDNFVYLLAKEAGRILTHSEVSRGIVGSNPEDEVNANEFAHHINSVANHGFFYNSFSFYPVIAFVGAAAVFFSLAFLASFFTKELFVDSSGEKEYSTSFVKVKANGDENYELDAFAQNNELLNTDNRNIVSESSSVIAHTQVETGYTSDVQSVYLATKSGKKYHLPGCVYVNGKDTVSISVSDIESGKYTACSKCIK